MQKFTRVYAYLRFSSDPQADGFSFERQREAVYRFTRANSISDDIIEFIEDPARSAFTGAHLSKGELGKLLKRLSTTSRVGDELLLFEAVDRASRQGPFLFSYMVGSFLQTGVFIHFLEELHPFSVDVPADPMLQMKLSIYASVANYESQKKSTYGLSNWKNKRKLARDSLSKMTREGPRWLEYQNGEFVPDVARVASIHAVFDLIKNGWGVGKIVRRANTEQWPVPGKGEKWHNSLIVRLASNRALLGEFQPHVTRKGKKIPEGDPIVGYYPAVVTPELFYSVRAARSTVAQFPNRRDEHNYNYLVGLGRCECGGTWRRLNKQSGKQRGYAQYSCSNRQIGATKCANLPARYFDHHFIAELCLKIPDFLAKIRSSTIDNSSIFSNELQDVERRLSNLRESIELNGDRDGSLTSRIDVLIDRKEELLQNIEKSAVISVPESGVFSEIEALSVYIPAFINYQESVDSDEAKAAFNARALFRSRLLSVVSQVTITCCRTKIDVVLTSKEVLTLTIEAPDASADSLLYGVAPDDETDNDFDIEGDRRELDKLEIIKQRLISQ